MKLRALAVLVVLVAPAPGRGGPSEHFSVSAAFQAPSKPDGLGAVAVTFRALDPDVHVNEEPAPRLKLDPAQTLLADRQAPPASKIPSFDPENAKYLDITFPVSFPVAWAGKPPKSPQSVKANVVYFYCSKREGWCRKGTSEVLFSVP
jgi:hypothetical protein